MGNHFREQESHAVNRRSLLKGFAAGGAALVATTETVQALGRLPTSDEGHLEACIAQLCDILGRMHPGVTVTAGHHLASRPDGSFRFSMQGNVEFHGVYDGEGLYELSIDGLPMPFWLEYDVCRRVSDGSPIPGMDFYWATQWNEGEPIDTVRRLSSPNIIRKLEV